MSDIRNRTALDMTTEEWKAYNPLLAIRQNQATTRELLVKRRRRAIRVARRAAGLLRKEFSAGRVVLFGSLANRDGFTLWSDIDLAAWGIPPDQFYTAVATITGLSAEFKIDLIDPEFCKLSLRNAIEHAGVEL